MNATTLSLSDAQTTPLLDRLTMALLLSFVATVQVSIVAAEALLVLLLFAWVAALVRDKTRPSAPRFFWPLLAYAAVTLMSSAFSIDPIESLIDSRQLFLFLIVPVVYDVARGARTRTVLDVIVTVGALAAAYGIIQYGMLHFDSLRLRPRGTMGHYMTYSGTLMLVIGVAAARIVFGVRDRLWPALVMPALIVALTLTFTRSAWVGVCVGVSLLFILKDFRLTGLIPVIIALLLALAPDRITDRIMSVFDLRDPSSRDRVAMLQTGAAMIKDHPLAGVGPNMVERLYTQYRDPTSVQKVNPHLHNVPVQIAAERGLPALAVWLAFIGMLAVGVFRIFRSGQDRVLAAGALAAIAAMLSAGMFEYNFGDSEFLMLFLILVTLPFAAERPDPHAVAAGPA
ncbi:MAG TPA: O-antigen ligase family protein [Vicinamibacterales bacterium]|nr:O-antigen ligase family protein [Vicinamibacterales bacterium]